MQRGPSVWFVALASEEQLPSRGLAEVSSIDNIHIGNIDTPKSRSANHAERCWLACASRIRVDAALYAI